jgi:diguanylate cyclase (GGDEF)-like protein
MTKKNIERVLLLEDNPGDARLLREMLNEEGSLNTQLKHLECMSDAENYLAENSVDMILLDLGLPDAQGLQAVQRAHAAAPHVPLVVLTGLDDESVAAQALQEGAQDYLIKGQIDTRGLSRALRYALERKTMESAALAMTQQMAHSAEHDFLTGLPNRMLLNDRVDQAIGLAARHMNKVAVLFLDLDGFKHINDSLGHPIGDKLLQSIAKRLADCIRGSDSVSRQGGDEFVVLLSELKQPDDAAITARRMLQAVAQPHSIDQHDLHVTASIGVSIYPDDGLNAETLIKNADTAMYQAKDNGRRSFQFFRPAMNVRAVERQFIEEGLRRALERRELALHYQPKVNLMTGAISGVEALLRWDHPARGLIAPSQFIPVAEDCGLILPIGTWVLRQACTQAKAWIDSGLRVTSMAVNVSAIQFRDKNFLDGLFAILAETGLDPRYLELELTEGVLIKHAEFTAAILQTLRKKGVRMTIDDFGTGYSSLSYLQRFPVDALKIDQSFVRQISNASDDTTIVKAVIGMARGLKLRVIAEGVETLEEVAFLRAYRCEEAQGYYFSRPLPAPQFAMLLRNGIPGYPVAVHRSPAIAAARAS